jgi:hypothetical protein
MVTSPSRAASPSGALNNPRTPAQKLAMQAADQAYGLSLTLKTHNKLDHMLLPEQALHPEQPCWVPVRPHLAELVHTFNAQLMQELDALMLTLDEIQALMAERVAAESTQ